MSVVALKLLAGTLFLVFSGMAFATMVHLLGAPGSPHAKALRIIHRASGAIAVVLFTLVAVICIAVDLRRGGDLNPRAAAHFAFAAAFIPLIVLKVLVVERYPELRNRLFGIGSFLFVLAFLVFATSSGYYLVRAIGTIPGDIQPKIGENLSFEKELFVVKCSKCHRLDKTLSARKTAEQWQQTVEAMRLKDPSWISPEEATRITRFLLSLEG